MKSKSTSWRQHVCHTCQKICTLHRVWKGHHDVKDNGNLLLQTLHWLYVINACRPEMWLHGCITFMVHVATFQAVIVFLNKTTEFHMITKNNNQLNLKRNLQHISEHRPIMWRHRPSVCFKSVNSLIRLYAAIQICPSEFITYNQC